MAERILKEKRFEGKPGPYCGQCPYRENPSVRKGGPKGGVMVVGSGPGEPDVKEGKRYSGLTGIRLRKQLGHAGLLLDDCWVDGVVQCKVPATREPTKTAMRCCRPLLEEALAECRPHTVITLGAEALEAFYPGGKLSYYHGSKIQAEDYVLVPMYQPNAFDDSPNLLLTIANDYRGLKGRPMLSPAAGSYKVSRALPAMVNDRYAVDTETDGLALTSRLLGVSYSDTEGEAAYVPARHHPRGIVFRDHAVMHNAKFDLGILQSNGVADIGDWEDVDDTMLLAYAMEKRPLGLKSLAAQELHLEMVKYVDVAEGGKTLVGVPDREVAEYSGADADVTLRLWGKLWGEATPRERNLYSKIEKPLAPILSGMELEGVFVDIPYLERLGGEIREEMGQIEAQLEYDYGLDRASLSRPAAMQDFIYGTLKLPVSALTDPDNPSTSRRILERIRDEHLAVDLVLRHRELATLVNNFVDGLVGKAAGGKVHPKFNQARVVTGRLSSSDPNFQGLPSRRTSDFRRAVVAPPGFVVAAFDNSQIDLRSLAHISGCPVLNAVFEADGDIHAETSMLIYGDVEGTHRFEAKAANFMPVYGGTYVGLARRTGLSEARAQEFLDAWYAHYHGVTSWLARFREQVMRDGWAETAYGRRRHIPELFTGGRAHALRQAQNHPVQGTSADVMKLQMIAVAPAAAPFVQIHDELGFYLPAGRGLRDRLREIRGLMEGVDCPFRLKVDVKVGPNLGDLKKVELK